MGHEQNWQPISQLSMFITMIDDQRQGARDQYQNLLQARPKPHVLDDETVQRVLTVYTEQLSFVPLYKNQIDKWQTEEALTSHQQSEIERLQRYVDEWEKTITDILPLAEELQAGTIDTILAQTDEELGLRASSLYRKKG